MYHLTVAAGGGAGKVGTEYEQLISKLMEVTGDPGAPPTLSCTLLPTRLKWFSSGCERSCSPLCCSVGVLEAPTVATHQGAAQQAADVAAVRGPAPARCRPLPLVPHVHEPGHRLTANRLPRVARAEHPRSVSAAQRAAE